MTIVLGIESSCDDTAAAIVQLGNSGDDPAPVVLAEAILGQQLDHAPYGGIVPEIAARRHVERLDTVVGSVMETAGLHWSRLDAVAATAGPGLIGGLVAGVMTGKAIALGWSVPFIAVNHLEGHALSPRLDTAIAFPYLLLLVSGGHCQIVSVAGLGQYRRLGATLDDAPGEAFDKTARLLGLPLPGGPHIERLAASGDPILLPRPLLDRPGLNMSFAGLKTAVRRAAEAETLTEKRRANICAGFQQAVVAILSSRSADAMDVFIDECGHGCFVAAGGVAANAALRDSLAFEARRKGLRFCAPPPKWCTDNAAMIAYAGALRLRAGLVDSLAAPVRARWPLDERAAREAPLSGHGKKGAKV